MQDVTATSPDPQPHTVLSSIAQPTTNKRSSLMPCSLTPFEEEQIKFAIGLRLLGEKKRARVLVFMETLRERKEDTSHGL